MANSSSAKKAAVQSEKRRLANSARKTAIKTAIKKVVTALAERAEAGSVDLLLRDVAAKLARAKSKRVLHRNTAANRLSKLAKKVAAYKKAAQTNV